MCIWEILQRMLEKCDVAACTEGVTNYCGVYQLCLVIQGGIELIMNDMTSFWE